MPLIRLKIVVLPEPFGPISAHSSPAWSWVEKLLTATSPPKRLTTFSSVRRLIMLLLLRAGWRGGLRAGQPRPHLAELLEEPVPAELLAAEQPLLVEEDHCQQKHGEQYHTHARHTGHLYRPEPERRLDGTQHLEKHRVEDGRDGAAGEAAHAAHHRDADDLVRQEDPEHVGVDGADQVGEQRPADADEERRQREGQ